MKMHAVSKRHEREACLRALLINLVAPILQCVECNLFVDRRGAAQHQHEMHASIVLDERQYSRSPAYSIE